MYLKRLGTGIAGQLPARQVKTGAPEVTEPTKSNGRFIRKAGAFTLGAIALAGVATAAIPATAGNHNMAPNVNVEQVDNRDAKSVAKSTLDFCNTTVNKEILGQELRFAAYHGDIEGIKKCLQQGADVNDKNDYGWTPLHIAAERGHAASIRLLVGRGADINTRSYHTWNTPVHQAAWFGNVDTIKALADLGSDINAKTYNGETPLHLVMIKLFGGHPDTMKLQLLVELGADVNAKDNTGQTPLAIAAMDGHVDAIKLLVKLGADVNSKDNNGWTPLKNAIWNNHADAVKVLKELGGIKPLRGM